VQARKSPYKTAGFQRDRGWVAVIVICLGALISRAVELRPPFAALRPRRPIQGPGGKEVAPAFLLRHGGIEEREHGSGLWRSEVVGRHLLGQHERRPSGSVAPLRSYA
jgi:hypothetical protein